LSYKTFYHSLSTGGEVGKFSDKLFYTMLNPCLAGVNSFDGPIEAPTAQLRIRTDINPSFFCSGSADKIRGLNDRSA
jgi:hypothetical protein